MRSLHLLTLSILSAVVSLPCSAQAEEHPMMHEAATHLQAARTAANPMEELKKARRSLEAARPNKQGKRVDAKVLVDRAIAVLEDPKRSAADRRIEADKLMQEALRSIEKGVALHPRDNTKR